MMEEMAQWFYCVIVEEVLTTTQEKECEGT